MIGRLAEFILFGIGPLLAGSLLMPPAFADERQTITGEVTYRERIALPPQAVLTVQLSDVSLADAPASVVAEQVIRNAGQVPVPFELSFDPGAIQPRQTYALSARITVDDTLWFVNDERIQVDPLSAQPQTILVKMVRKEAATPPDAVFSQPWVLTFIDGVGAIDGSRTTFHVESGGKVTGQAPCNRYFASATIDGFKMTITKPGATMMACEPDLMTQEHAFFDALEKVSDFRIENATLLLTAADGRQLLRFAAGA